ncbi:MAG: tetratricopeptide repeat protein [Candidatus Paceibacterota bacterium]
MFTSKDEFSETGVLVEKPDSKISLLAYLASLFGIGLLPLVFMPWFAVPLMATKVFWLLLVVLITFIIWLIDCLQKGRISIPGKLSLLLAGAMVLILLLSSMLADSFYRSLAGFGFDTGSALALGALFIVFILAGSIYHNRDRVLTAYVLLFGVAILVGLYTILKFVLAGVGPTFIPALWPTNLIGSWYGLGIFFGLIALSALVMVEFFPLKESRLFRFLLYFILGFSFLILVMVNFQLVWIVLAVFSLLLATYIIGANRTRPAGEGDLTTDWRLSNIFRPSLVVAVISLLFIVFGGAGGFIDNQLNKSIYEPANFSFVDVRPSWSGTVSVVRNVWEDNLLLGVGVNNFDRAWLLHRPQDVNLEPYWNINFKNGFGLIPSLGVTTGLLGFIVWILFLITLVGYGLKGVLSKKPETFDRLIILLLFVSSTYLWVMAFIYPVSIAVFALAFFLSGLLVAQLSANGIIGRLTIGLPRNTKFGFITILIFVIFIAGGLIGSYLTVKKYWAGAIFYDALAESAGRSLEETENAVWRASNLDKRNELYFRTLANIGRLKMNQMLQTESASAEELRERFQSTLDLTLAYATQAITLDPFNYENWLSRGLIYEFLIPLEVSGAGDLARFDYNQALTLNPHSPGILIDLARLSYTEGDEASARQYLEESLIAKANFSSPLLMLAQLDLEAGNYDQALARAEQAVAFDPNNLTTYFQLGLLRYEVGDYEGAVAALERALILSPGQINANAQYFLGLSYDQLGRNDLAIEQFESIREFNPDNTEVRLIIGNLRAGRPALSGVRSSQSRTGNIFDLDAETSDLTDGIDQTSEPESESLPLDDESVNDEE